MDIISLLVPEDKYALKCPHPMKPSFIVVHNTANDASAHNEISYMRTNQASTSFHYAVDDNYVVQGIPEDRNAWHAGDGPDGEGNRKGIAVEICYSLSGGERFHKAERLAAKFIAHKLDQYGWGLKQVLKHQDFSKKNCPHRTLNLGWERFLNMIREEMVERADAPAPWAEEAWNWAQSVGLMDGTRPKDPVTRQEIALIAQRMERGLRNANGT